MTLSSDISTTSTALSNIKQAIIDKGVTPSGNITTYATAISNIQTGFNELPSYQVSNGVASRRSGALTGNEFSNITSIGSNGLYYAFYGCTGLTGNVDFSALTTVSGINGLSSAFYDCTGLTSVSFPVLTTVSGSYGLSSAFYGCTGLTSVSFPVLTSIGGYGLYYAFYGCTGLTGNVDFSALTTVSGINGLSSAFRDCTGLTSVSFPVLTTVSGSNGLSNAFRGCTGLTSVSFPALKTTSFGSYTNQFSNMLSGTGTTVTHTLHFPSNLQTTISGLTGYPLFGGTSGYVTLSFDLPATS